MFGRRTRTRLSFLNPLDQPAKASIISRRDLDIGTSVKADVRGKWVAGVVREKVGLVMYKVEIDGRISIKHIDQLIATSPTSSEIIGEEGDEWDELPVISANPVNHSNTLRKSRRERKPIERYQAG
eukprot:sb/3475541/